jgi:hypothetical protein
MDKILRYFGHIAVNDMGHVIHVQAPGCNIGRHQHLEAAFLKPTQSSVPLRLRAIAMNHGGRKTIAYKFLRQPLGASLGAVKIKVWPCSA